MLAFAFLVLTALAIAFRREVPSTALGVYPSATLPSTKLPSASLGTSGAGGAGPGSEWLLRARHFVLLPVWAGCAWLIRRFANRGNPRRDPLLLPVVLLLAGWGILLVWRLSPDLGARQISWFLVGTVALIEVLRSPPGLGWLRRYRYLWLAAGIAVTALTLVFGTNPAGGEPRLWLGCCGIYLQPSEPLRLLLIAFAASYLAERRLVERQSGWLSDFLPLLAAGGLAGLLLVAQRDLGAAMLSLGLLAFLIYIAYGHLAVLIGALGLAVAGGIIGYLTLGIVRTRVDSWINPWLDPTGSGYQIVQSLIAIASGGLLGLGPGRGAPTAVPVVHSDFMFAAVAEEWGMVGGLAAIGLFAVLVGRGLRAAGGARDPFAALLAAGVSVALGLQALLIMGGVMRLLPITGVTLPFVSYGGSSLVTSFIAAGFLVLISTDRNPRLGPFSVPILRTHALLTLGWAALALALGWWAIVRAESLTTRTDNPRRSLASLNSQRGEIVDWDESELAASIGTRGSYQRVYSERAGAPVIGYDSSVYGQAGIESSMDAYLRGENGPDAFSIWWSKLLYGVPPPGFTVRLTLDSDLQRAAAEGLAGQRGAAVVLDAVSGDILAMASSPSFDPNTLESEWATLVARDDGPLLNRGTQARYQPGMVLAPLLFAWANSSGLIAPDLPAPNFGADVAVSGQSVGCQRPIGAGDPATWQSALVHACAGPFAALGDRLGIEGIRQAFDAYGLLDAPQIRLVVAPGVPLEATENSALTAIGQAGLTVTPLQVARAFAVLAGAGVRPALSLVEATGPTLGAWQPLGQLEQEEPVLAAPDAQIALDSLTGYGDGLHGYEALALSGSGPLAWFIGMGPAGELTVILFESGSVDSARELGITLLRLARDLDLTPRGG